MTLGSLVISGGSEDWGFKKLGFFSTIIAHLADLTFDGWENINYITLSLLLCHPNDEGT